MMMYLVTTGHPADDGRLYSIEDDEDARHVGDHAHGCGPAETTESQQVRWISTAVSGTIITAAARRKLQRKTTYVR